VSGLQALIDDWLRTLPDEATAERVRESFWYIRLPGVARQWIPIEIDATERTVKLTSHVIIEPDENHAEVYSLLLRHNHQASGVAFSIDGKEGVICLVTRVPNGGLSLGALDEAVGLIVQKTEEVFRSILQIGFASRMKKR
jgi:hypothetical protein